MIRLLILSSICFYTSSAIAQSKGDERYEKVSSVIGEEMGKARKEFQSKISAENYVIDSLKKQSKKVIRDSKAAAKSEQQGAKVFEKYITLLEVRYVDNEGEFDPRRQISKEDVENINKMFKAYLKKTALTRNVSAENAIEALEEGTEELEEMIEMHANPDESNNSELQIIEGKLEQAEKRKEIILNLVQKLGIKGIKPNHFTAQDAPKSDSKHGH